MNQEVKINGKWYWELDRLETAVFYSGNPAFFWDIGTNHAVSKNLALIVKISGVTSYPYIADDGTVYEHAALLSSAHDKPEERNQETEHPKQTHSELVASAAKWLKRHDENTIVPNCSLIYMEQKSLANTGEIPDVIGFGGEISVVIECKASRKDFLADAKRPFRSLADGMGNQRYFFAEKGTIDGRSLPASWGLIEIEGTEISIKERSICVHANYKSERELLLSVIRSMNK